jgi:4-hydroxy-tetrahydrodipicolinate synthase
MSILSGVFPVVPTPFTANGSIDPAALKPLIDFVIRSGANGLVYPGMASEVETLSAEERLTLVQAVGEALNGRLPFIVGASDADPGRASARAEEGRAFGACAAMIMAPAHCGRDITAHIAFYSAVAAKTGLPLMLQNAPSPMGAGLNPAEVAEIAKAVSQIRFVKEETLPCGQNITKIRALAGAHLDCVFGGAGARYLIDELARGAAGTMPAVEMTDVHVRIVNAWREGDAHLARQLYSRTLPLLLFQQIFRVHLTKAVLAARSLLSSRFVRAAGPSFDDGDERECKALIAEASDLFVHHRTGH